jgi:peptide/nickel transport system permease protein
VKAAEVMGAKPLRIIWREVLPNVLPAMMSIALLGVGVVIVAEGALSLLGAGITGVPTWGNMISEGRNQLRTAPYIVFIPSIAMFFTVLSLNYLGDVVRARFEVRESML